MDEQELAFTLNMFEQQITQLQQQIQVIDAGINELASLSLSLDDLKDAKGKESFSSIGRGIYVKSKLESDDLIVDIGNQNFVKKSIPETKELIQSQIEKLEKIKNEVEHSLEDIDKQLTSLIVGQDK